MFLHKNSPFLHCYSFSIERIGIKFNKTYYSLLSDSTGDTLLALNDGIKAEMTLMRREKTMMIKAWGKVKSQMLLI